jgi:hypothetical protein
MIYNFNYSNSSNRQNVLDYLKENKFKRVLDVGFSGGNWSSEYVTHYVDFFNSPSTSKIPFIGIFYLGTYFTRCKCKWKV